MRHLLLITLFLLARPVLAADSGVILAYHHVASDTPASTSLSPEDFEGHLRYLKDNDYEVIGLDRLIDSIRSATPLPERAVVITFDDGYRSIYETAFPMLQSYGYPFTLFLSTQPINDRQGNYMNWEQIREMSDAGVIIANHLVNHPYMLEKTPNETDQQHMQRMRTELTTAEETITEHTGQNHRYLAYPYGEYDSAIKAMIEELGYIGIAQNSGAVNASSDMAALPRYPLASIYANIETAKTKFATLAFNAELLSPSSPVTSERRPTASIKFNPGNYNLSQIGCFANSEALDMVWLDEEQGIVEITPTEEMRGRRWRYICTAPAKDSRRYYWYSVQWINTGD